MGGLEEGRTHFHSFWLEVGSRSSTVGLVALEVVDHQQQMVLYCQAAYQVALEDRRSSGGRSWEVVVHGRWCMPGHLALEPTTFSVWLASVGMVGSGGGFG